MLFSEWYNKQCIHKNWQSYTQINRGTICAKELPFRVQPFRRVNCGLIPLLKTFEMQKGDNNTFCWNVSEQDDMQIGSFKRML